MASIRVEIRDAKGKVVAAASQQIFSGTFRRVAKDAGDAALDLAIRRAENNWIVGGDMDRELGIRLRRGEIGRKMPFTPER